MERRRLKLHSPSALTPEDWAVLSPRLELPGRCVSVVDTDQGHAASLWALALLSALSAAGHRVPVVLSAFGQAPELLSASQRAFEAVASQVVRLAVPAPPQATRLEDLVQDANAKAGWSTAPCWLMVGLPAALTFEAKLSTLVVGDRGPERWPRALRQLRPSFALEVASEPRPALAVALARALLATSPAVVP